MFNQLQFTILLIIFISVYSGIIDAYYYDERQPLTITASGMNSLMTQLPYKYSYLNLCDSGKKAITKRSIGDLLTGSKMYYTNYNVSIDVPSQCEVACTKNFTIQDINIYEWLIKRKYFINFYLDSLPSGYNYTDYETSKVKLAYHLGVPIGFKRDSDYFINNHYNIFIDLHEKKGKFQVVGINIEPLSLSNNSQTDCLSNTYDDFYLKERQLLTEGPITFTYSVYFSLSNITFSSRFDHILSSQNKEMHWVGLINANILIFIISFLVFYILSRAIKKDIEIYNQKIVADEVIDEYGWKQVCNDVFRRPKNLTLLSACIGTGIEIFLMITQTLILTVLGFASPENRGEIINLMAILFCIMGVVAGFTSSYFYKMNGGKDWVKCCLLTIFLFPSIGLLILLIVRIVFSFEKSSAGFNFYEFLMVIVLWICIECPLVLLGCFFGLKTRTIKFPCKVNPVPSTIGRKPWYLKLKYITWFTGLIPFATIFIEFIYIMAAIWKYQIYFIASFIGLSILFIVLSSSEISIIFIYLNLCKGDYNWWWKSFLVSASPAIYVALYSVYYFFYLNMKRFSSNVIYFCLMGSISTLIGIVCGACGVCFTFLFLYFIYSKIKID